MNANARGRDFVLIEDWSITKDGRVSGRVFGHPAASAGSLWATAPVAGVRGRLAVSGSGRHYMLGAPKRPAEWHRLVKFVKPYGVVLPLRLPMPAGERELGL